MICAYASEHTPGRPALLVVQKKRVGSRATAIPRFDGSAFLQSPQAKKIALKIGTKIEEPEARIKQLGWIMTIEPLRGRDLEISRMEEINPIGENRSFQRYSS